MCDISCSLSGVFILGNVIFMSFKDVSGSFLCASYCAGVPQPQTTWVADQNPSGGVTFYFFNFTIFNILLNFPVLYVIKSIENIKKIPKNVFNTQKCSVVCVDMFMFFVYFCTINILKNHCKVIIYVSCHKCTFISWF